jgi:hypothetical protein
MICFAVLGVAGHVVHQLTYGSENRRERLLQRYRRLERKSDPVTAAIPVMRLIEKPPTLEHVPCYSGKRVSPCLSCGSLLGSGAELPIIQVAVESFASH